MPMVNVNLLWVPDVFLMIWLLEMWLLGPRCPRAMLIVDFPSKVLMFIEKWVEWSEIGFGDCV